MYRPLPKEVTIKKSYIEGLGLFADENLVANTKLSRSLSPDIVDTVYQNILSLVNPTFYKFAYSPAIIKHMSTENTYGSQELKLNF